MIDCSGRMVIINIKVRLERFRVLCICNMVIVMVVYDFIFIEEDIFGISLRGRKLLEFKNKELKFWL